MAISMIGEGCKGVIKPHLASVVGLMLPLFTDPHPRVRWAAANTAGQMSTDFGPKLQKQFHADFMPRFVTLLGDNANPKYVSSFVGKEGWRREILRRSNFSLGYNLTSQPLSSTFAKSSRLPPLRNTSLPSLAPSTLSSRKTETSTCKSKSSPPSPNNLFLNEKLL